MDVVNYVQYKRFGAANNLLSISRSSFLGQQLAPYTPINDFHDRGNLRRDY